MALRFEPGKEGFEGKEFAPPGGYRHPLPRQCGHISFNQRSRHSSKLPCPARLAKQKKALYVTNGCMGLDAPTKQTKPKNTKKANLAVRIQPSACTHCWAADWNKM